MNHSSYNIKISLIVPIYNVEQYLSQCIDSILTQTFTDFELLLIDDGSSDNSGTICDKYAQIDSRIKVFHKTNEGASAARNLGIEHATGEWINFIDSDDWIPSDYLETIMNDINIADLTFWGCSIHRTDNSQTCYRPSERYATEKNEIESYLAYLKNNSQQFEYLGYTWNKLFKTPIIKDNNIRFIKNLNMREDEVFTLSYAKHIHSIRIKSSPLYNYRIINNSLTHRAKTQNEYLLLIKELTKVLTGYSNKKLILIEENALLYYYFNVLILEKYFTKIWFKLLNKFIDKGKYLKEENSIMSKKMNLIFKYKFKFYQYFSTLLLIFLYKKQILR